MFIIHNCLINHKIEFNIDFIGRCYDNVFSLREYFTNMALEHRLFSYYTIIFVFYDAILVIM